MKKTIDKLAKTAEILFWTGATAMTIYALSNHYSTQKHGWYYNENNEIKDEFFMEHPNQSKNIYALDDFENTLMKLNPKNQELKGWIYVPDYDKNGTFAGHQLYSKPDSSSKKLGNK